MNHKLKTVWTDNRISLSRANNILNRTVSHFLTLWLLLFICLLFCFVLIFISRNYCVPPLQLLYKFQHWCGKNRFYHLADTKVNLVIYLQKLGFYKSNIYPFKCFLFLCSVSHFSILPSYSLKHSLLNYFTFLISLKPLSLPVLHSQFNLSLCSKIISSERAPLK